MVNSLSQESSRMDGRKKKEREDSRDMWKESQAKLRDTVKG